VIAVVAEEDATTGAVDSQVLARAVTDVVPVVLVPTVVRPAAVDRGDVAMIAVETVAEVINPVEVGRIAIPATDPATDPARKGRPRISPRCSSHPDPRSRD